MPCLWCDRASAPCDVGCDGARGKSPQRRPDVATAAAARLARRRAGAYNCRPMDVLLANVIVFDRETPANHALGGLQKVLGGLAGVSAEREAPLR